MRKRPRVHMQGARQPLPNRNYMRKNIKMVTKSNKTTDETRKQRKKISR
jgi:hypothetical protein